MRVLVTGSAGHLGEALVRVLREAGDEVTGLDVLASPETTVVGSVADRGAARAAMAGADVVLHTATLHKPHLTSHPREAFVETNVRGTLVLLEEAVAAGAGAFVFTSSTTTFGRALHPAPGEPAAWIDEAVVPRPKNVYGATKTAAEDLCELVHREHRLPVVVLRTSRFFPEGDDVAERRSAHTDEELKTGELLHRRVDLEDVVEAHRLAAAQAAELGFARLVVSAPTPFRREDAPALGRDAPSVLDARVPGWREVYEARGWRMFATVDRVYDSARAQAVLGWRPRWDFAFALERLRAGEAPRSALAEAVGAKGYHDAPHGPYTARRRSSTGPGRTS